jgi:predicted ester cyclase
MATDNIALMKRFMEEVWNKGNLKVADELSSSASIYHDPIAKELRSLDDFKKYDTQLRVAFPDFHVIFDDIATLGDKVYTRWTVTGTNKGSFMGMAPTNKRSITVGMSMNRIQGGKIVETWMNYDVLGLLQQLGIAPPIGTSAQPVAAAPIR